MKVAFVTKHGKDAVILPILNKYYNITESETLAIDTDKFGTFNRLTKREGTATETLIRKIEAGKQESNADLIVASEGSFGPDPILPFLPLDAEQVALYEKRSNNIYIGEKLSNKTNFSSLQATTLEEAFSFIDKQDIPKNNILIRKNEKSKNIFADFESKKQAKEIAEKVFSKGFKKQVFLETDMRSDRNQIRQSIIQDASEELVNNLKRICPGCESKGVRPKGIEPGLPCKICNLPTDEAAFKIYSCPTCEHEYKEKIEGQGNPANCARCNP